VWTAIDWRNIEQDDKNYKQTNGRYKAHSDTNELATLVFEIERYIWQECK